MTTASHSDSFRGGSLLFVPFYSEYCRFLHPRATLARFGYLPCSGCPPQQVSQVPNTFQGKTMQEFFSQYAKIQNPTFEMVIFTFLLAFLCSTLIALVYWITSPTTLRTGNYIQSLILSSIIATMILQSIGDSVASGLGILGALTIINFRTSFRDPRDIIFMFAALGTGIACGSYVFPIAIMGTLMFCFIAVSLRYTPFHMGNHVIWELRIRIESRSVIPAAEKIFEQFCRRYTLDDIRNEAVKGVGPVMEEREYFLVLQNEDQNIELIQALETAGVIVRRLSKQSATENTVID